MNIYRKTSLFIILTLFIILLAGCGTSKDLYPLRTDGEDPEALQAVIDALQWPKLEDVQGELKEGQLFVTGTLKEDYDEQNLATYCRNSIHLLVLVKHAQDVDIATQDGKPLGGVDQEMIFETINFPEPPEHYRETPEAYRAFVETLEKLHIDIGRITELPKP